MSRTGASAAIALTGLAVYWALCFIVTHVPLSTFGANEAPHIPHQDKIAHLVLYSGLAWLFAWSLTLLGFRKGLRAIVLVVVCTYGAFDEIFQSFIPSRSMDFSDWLADILGCCIGLVSFEAWGRLTRSGLKPASLETRPLPAAQNSLRR